MDRKQFLSRSLQAGIGALVAGPAILSASGCGEAPSEPTEGMPDAEDKKGDPPMLAQVALPYAYDALAPHIDAATMELHYTKHHAGYVKNANEAIADEGVHAANEGALLARISAYSTKLRNNAGGVWNHNFFWEVMAPPSGTNGPEGKVLDAINAAFGSLERFKELFTDAAMKRFGSGWAWLVDQHGQLAIGSTPNQDNPLMDVSEFKGRPLLGIDVWEHAYYLHYQNKRNEYIANWWNVVNWNSVALRLG